MTITPEGRATDVAWRNFKRMPAPAIAFLERKIPTWRFRPGEVDGVPVATGTSLVIHVVATAKRDRRHFDLDIAGVVTGPSLIGPVIKRRSPQWKVLSGGRSKSGREIVDLLYEPGRPPVMETIEFATSTDHPELVAALAADTLWDVGQWMVRHETLDGLPVPARLRFANVYCYLKEWCDSNRSALADALPGMPPRQPVPLHSEATLLDDVVTLRDTSASATGDP